MSPALQGKRQCVVNIPVFPDRAAIIVMRRIIILEAGVTLPAGAMFPRADIVLGQVGN